MRTDVLVIVIAIVVLFVAKAMGQTSLTPQEQALSEHLLRELNASVQCSASLVATRTELEKAKAELAKLKPPETK